MTLRMTYQNRLEDKYDYDHLSGVVVWECSNSEAQMAADALYMTNFPGRSDWNCPRVRRTRIRFNYLPGRAQITAYYKTPRVPGVARLFGSCSSRLIPRYKDVNGKVIEGMEDNPNVAGYVHEYKIVKGHNYQTEPIERVVLKTASDTLDLGVIRDRRGKINADALPNFGADPGILLLWDVKYQGTPWERGTLWYLDYIFLVDPNGWNTGLKVKKHIRITQESDVFDYTNTPLGRKALRSITVPKTVTRVAGLPVLTDSEEEDREPYLTANFSDLNAMVRW